MLKVGPSIRFATPAGLLLVALLLAGCWDDQSASNSGSATSSSSASTASTASNTPATASGPDSAALEWIAPQQNTNGSSDTDLAGYHIYYGTDAGNLSQSIDVPGAATTTYVITGLAPGTYFFAVNAYNAMGIDSGNSDIASKTI
jgi:hypothetical protein